MEQHRSKDPQASYLGDLAKRGRLSAEQRLELEDHLQSAHESGIARGLNHEQAQAAAIASLGSIPELATEYRKVTAMKPISRLAGIGIALGTIACLALPGSYLGNFIDVPSALLVAGVVLGGLIASFGPVAMMRCIRQGLETDPMPGRDVATSVRIAKHGYRLCWAAGALGVLLGVIQILSNLTDPAEIGPGLSVSLFTLFYGALLAEVVFSNLSQWLHSGDGMSLAE